MRNIFFLNLSFLFMGCASIFQGTLSDVEIINAPHGVKVTSADGVVLPTEYKKVEHFQHLTFRANHRYYTIDSTTQIVQLRSNKDHQLILKVDSMEHPYSVYAKMNPWWLVADVICGVIPAIYDAVTGSWNYFEKIEYRE
jgi:hypothetical protein